MSTVDAFEGLFLALLAMYGLGLAVSWLLPAPEGSTWVFRLGVAPLYSIGLASLVGWGALRVGVGLEPQLLVAMALALWAVVLFRRRDLVTASIEPVRALAPVALVLMGLASWFVSLLGFGMYLPNRDFKNHAYFVAQVASTRSSDASLVLRQSPVSDPEEALFYPLGLHTLLGWALPTSDGSSVAITAAAAVLAASISAPLGLICLARMWNPGSAAHWKLAGLAAVCVPSMTQTFGIGSVVLIVATATYGCALASLWLWVRNPAWGEAVALALVAWGLFSAHVAEALGLFLVAALCVPTALRRMPGRRALSLVLVGTCLVALGMVVARGALARLASRASMDWDLQPNTEGPVLGAAVVMFQSLGARGPVTMVWVLLCAGGTWYAVTRGLSPFPLVSLVVPLGLGIFALWAGVPDLLGLATAPWYGSTSRISLMAIGPVILAATLVPAALLQGRTIRPAVKSVVGVLAVGVVVALSLEVVPTRRSDLAASLAGAGDSQQIAKDLRNSLQTGETVMNLEADGTANLYAFARVPILDAFRTDSAAGAITSPAWPDQLSDDLLRLSEPRVARQMQERSVAVIVLGTTSRYWGVGVAYRWQDVAAQPQVRLRTIGTDMVVLDYIGDSR